MGPMSDSGKEPSGGILQDALSNELGLQDIQNLQQQGDAFAKKPEKSRRQSKLASTGQDSDNPNIKRRTSKLGLFGLFNRSKVALDVETPQDNLESHWEGIVSTERPVTRDPSAAYIPPDSDLMPIQETEDMQTGEKLQHQASKSRLRNRHSFKRESKRDSRESVPTPMPASTWNAPPLFQVYPQSVKYSTLKAPLMSAEAILRLSKEKNALSESNPTSFGERSGSIDGKPLKEKKLKRSTALETMAKGEWVDKTYVLVTAGYLLQYAGQGTYDRVPEKILQLSEISAAFASDAIPGRPFVLQVSQALNEDGTVETEISRSMFKKMGGLRADMRRAVSNLLLVFDSPEEMNEWLIAVRKEIEALGGKECNPEMPWDEPEDKMSAMNPLSPSPRYLVMRDPNQFSPKLQSPKSWEPPHDVSLGAKVLPEEKPQEIVKSPVSSVSNRQSMGTQNSTKSRYVSDTHASIDQVHLDRLRESYASTAERTTSTSRDSSPNRSPLLDQDFISEIRAKPLAKSSTYPETIRFSRQRLAESTMTERESLQPTPTPISRPSSAGLSSTSGPPSETTTSTERAMSPAPNFSVPSFSKRYSAASASPPLSAKAQSPVPTTALQGSSVFEDEESQFIAEEGPSTVGQLHTSYKSSPRALARHSSPQPAVAHLSTPPTSSHSHITPPGSSDGERHFSRRFSSLEYGRGVSPVQPPRHSPSPHPPPNVPLPPLPDSGISSKRTSLLPPTMALPNAPLPPLPVSRPSSTPPPAPPPTGPLPPIPTERRASSRASTPGTMRARSTTPSCSLVPSPASSTSPFPPPSTALPPVPKGARPTTPIEKRQPEAERRQSKLDLSPTLPNTPASGNTQAPDILVTTPPLPQAGLKTTSTMEHPAMNQAPNSITPFVPQESSLPSSLASSLPSSSSSTSSPPKPTRVAPPPPSPAAVGTPSDVSQSTIPNTLARAPMSSATNVPPAADSSPVTQAGQLAPSNPLAVASREAPSLSPRAVPQQPPRSPLLNAASASPSSPRSPTPPFVHPRKSTPRIGREPPPVFSPRMFPMPIKTSPTMSPPPPSVEEVALPSQPNSKIFTATIAPPPPPLEVHKHEEREAPSSPHPFIPPIRLSHSREKGSFDGPWNKEYGSGVRGTFLDLGAA